jgi:hypothetical protein
VILLLPIVVIVLVAVATVLGIGPMAIGDERTPRHKLPLAMLVAVPVGVVLVLVLLGGVVGMDMRAEHEPSSTAAPQRATTTTTEVVAPVAAIDAEPLSAVLGPIVTIDQRVRAIGQLEPDTVLRLRVAGFPPFALARAEQCTSGACGNQTAVQFREDGTAELQYLVVDDFLGSARGRCRADAAPCSIVIEEVDGDARAEITTVFGEALPPTGRLTVHPTTGLDAGDQLSVELDGFRSGTEVEVVLCAAPATRGPERCGEPGPVVPVTIGDDGTATATLAAGISSVGTERVTCGRGSGCAVAVRSATAFVRASQVPLRFAAPPGADYDTPRLLFGLATAVLLLLGAAVLVRRTDWSAIGEEAAPEIDDAAYADLDAIIALLPPEEADDLPEPAGGRSRR